MEENKQQTNSQMNCKHLTSAIDTGGVVYICLFRKNKSKSDEFMDICKKMLKAWKSIDPTREMPPNYECQFKNVNQEYECPYYAED